MASDLAFIHYVCDQISAAGAITCRKMFGEYAIYCNGKVIALVCDNQFYLKPTNEGRAFIGQPTEAPPYPGAKMYFLLTDQLDEREWMAQLVRATEQALPLPKPKKPRRAARTAPSPE